MNTHAQRDYVYLCIYLFIYVVSDPMQKIMVSPMIVTPCGVNPKGLAQVVEALISRFVPFKVQGSTPHECKQSLGVIPPDKKPAI
jgi:hypothetical protein